MQQGKFFTAQLDHLAGSYLTFVFSSSHQIIFLQKINFVFFCAGKKSKITVPEAIAASFCMLHQQFVQHDSAFLKLINILLNTAGISS